MVLQVTAGQLVNRLPFAQHHRHTCNCIHLARRPFLSDALRQLRRQERQRQSACVAQKTVSLASGQTQIGINPAPVQAPAQQHSQRQGAAVWLAIAALVAAAGYRWVSQNSSKQAAVPPQPDPDVGQLGDPSDTKEYQKALARTRQAVSVHKALGFMTAGTPARAMVELKRALNENAIVREPLLNARYEKKQLQDLYRLHVQNSEMPLQFSTLLQLREMLALPDNEAEALEAEVMNSGVQFSI